jgi:NAD(P)-dependent dehydrogenase (short-subunit alcohol dehydrogenase family)
MILVTGASQGIGLACALVALERTTGQVLITGRSREKLDAAVAQAPAASRSRLLTLVNDHSCRRDVDALAARMRAADRVDGAILCVGANPFHDDGPCRIHKLEPAVIERTIATNCTHTMLLTAALLERFRRQRHGALVWIGSLAAAAGMPGAALYGASKAFLGGLARCAATEYAGHGIRLHVAHPGLVRTPRTEALADSFSARHGVVARDAADVGRDVVDLLLGGEPAAVEVMLG